MTQDRNHRNLDLRVWQSLFAGTAMTVALILIPVISVSGAEKPTETGDVIGTAAMLSDGTLLMNLRSVECNGTIAEGLVRTTPSQKNYKDMLNRLGGLKVGEIKPYRAGPSPRCPPN